MTTVATFTLTGDKELDRTFRELPAKLQKKVLRPAVRAGAKIVHQAAKARMPAVSGTAKGSLKVRAAKRSRKYPDSVRANVITSGEKGGLFKGKSFYLGFVEYGWKTGSRKAYPVGPNGAPRHKMGRRWLKERKQIAGKHYLKQAADSSGEQAKQASIAIIRAGIEREAKSNG